jgi:hypothetical protein
LRSYLQVLDRNTENVIGHLVNITQAGAMMISEEPVSADTSLRLRLVLPETFEGTDVIDIRSRSVWCQKDRFNPELYASGFMIEHIHQLDAAFIERFIEKYCLNSTVDTNIQVH